MLKYFKESSMLNIPSETKIYLYKEPINMLKSFEGISSIIDSFFKEQITSGAFFVFINRKKDRMKVIYWDGDGLVIWYKRLEKGTFAKKNFDQTTLSRKEFFMLLEGITPRKIQARHNTF